MAIQIAPFPTFAAFMQAPVLHRICDQHLWLSGYRSVYWEERKTLIVSDLHFGKTGHFRKSGIPVPQTVYKEDLQRLLDVLHHFRPEQMIVVGDFFHSHANTELNWFRKWRDEFSSLRIILVRGNHDILKREWYVNAGIEVIEDELSIYPFHFTHERCNDMEDHYTFCGHIHPGIILNGLGKQSLRFPCFYFSEKHCILPAFSRFTGMALVDPEEAESVFAIVENSLVKL